MWNLEAEGQPKNATLRFEKGQHVYWTPNESAIKVPKNSEVTFKVYNGETRLHECTVIFECVEQNNGTAEFEIYLNESDGLQMVYIDGGIRFVEQSSISNVGGVDGINDSNSYLPNKGVAAMVTITIEGSLYFEDQTCCK